MADCAVFASGNGSNFEALAERIAGSGHRITCLVCDNPRALVIERAKRFSIPVLMVDYGSGSREEAENAILEKLRPYAPELIVLAGFMRILTPRFLASFPDRVVNIHPTLLPKHPGVTGNWESPSITSIPASIRDRSSSSDPSRETERKRSTRSSGGYTPLNINTIR